jgi:hypothetical protein
VQTTSKTFLPIASVLTPALRPLAIFNVAGGRVLGIAFGLDPRFFVSLGCLPVPFSRRYKAWTLLMPSSRQHQTHHHL